MPSWSGLPGTHSKSAQRRFSGIDALRAQIGRDLDRVRALGATPVATFDLAGNAAIMAHELGHTYGLHHTPPNPGDKFCNPTTNIGSYPQYKDPDGNKLAFFVFG